MGGAIRRLWFLAASFLLLSLAGWMSPAAMAQQGTATINGVVKDPIRGALGFFPRCTTSRFPAASQV